MKKNEFFESLVNEVNNGVLPFNEKDWQLMRARLDETRKRKVIPLIPVRLRYISAGVAAALIIGISLLYKPDEPSKPDIQHQSYHVRKDLSESKDHKQKNEPCLVEKNLSPTFAPHPGKIGNVSEEDFLTKETLSDASIVFSDMQNLSDKEINEKELIEKSAEIAVPEEKNKRTIIKGKGILPVWNKDHFRNDRSVFFAGGGVNYGVQTMGYAVKLGLEKPLTTRFSVHTALAVNTNDRNITVNEIDRIVPKNIFTTNGNYTTYDTFYKQSHRDFAQTFAQALAGVDYKLYKKGKLGLSADAVRLLKSRQEVDAFNEELMADKPTSLWNIGLRIQYTQQITRHFDIGTLYRQDVSSKLNGTWENNFFQLMLIYKAGGK